MNKNEHAEWQLTSLLSSRVLATRELMIRVLTSGTKREDDIVALGQQLRTIHARIADVFAGKQTDTHSAAGLAGLLNTHSQAEISLFSALHTCFEETKSSLCPSIQQAGEMLDASAKRLAMFLYEFHPSLMDGFLGVLLGEAREMTESRRHYVDHVTHLVQHWTMLTKEMAVLYLDGKILDSMNVAYRLIEASNNMAFLWAKIARHF